MPFVTLNDYRLYYEEQGAGPPVILLHNATGSTRDWRKVSPLLVAEGFRVIAYDRRGFGRSDPLAQPDWPLDYLRHSRDELIAFLNSLQLEHVALVGNSDGATIALLAAASHPTRIAGVVAESPHMWYEKESLLPAFAHFQQRMAQSARFWRAMARAHGERAEDVVRRWRTRWLDPSFFTWDERDVLTQITCPVLVLHGRQDIFFPVSHSEQIVRFLKRARFKVFETAGHTPHLEIAIDYTKVILPFLKSLTFPPPTPS